ncbi:hypothetical protein D9758_013792 [Tetrapyrgos nigripes]|uniref:Uncharacterized protein n=1 Tax=Tetrapyrgos nigripes TaxID=182062 RepID=A0A8H5D4Q4_9AGAR|nr:hypothetical protein D9758_013792 [Tetrapyrgos nigripes]
MSSTNRVLAGPPGDACFNRGVQHTGTPAEKAEKIGGIPMYVSEPPSSSGAGGGGGGKKVILYLADVYGLFYLNNQLVQDYFAEGGFHVLGIDYFDEDPVHKHTEADFDRSAWIANAKKRAGEWVPKWFKAVKEIYGMCACMVLLFAVRGDPEVGDERWAKEESARGILVWFNRFTEEVAKAT